MSKNIKKSKINVNLSVVLFFSLASLIIGRILNISLAIEIAHFASWVVAIMGVLFSFILLSFSKKAEEYRVSEKIPKKEISLMKRLVVFPILLILLAVLVNLWYGWNYLAVLLTLNALMLYPLTLKIKK